MTIWEPQAGAHKNIYFFKKSWFWLSSISSQGFRPLGQLLLCIHVDHHWNFHQKITAARILGHGEELPGLRRPFLGAGKMVYLRQIRQNPEIVAKNSIFFLFSFFSRLFFSFLFSILVGFSRFWIKFDKIQKLQKNSSFFSLFSFFFRIIFEPKRRSQLIFELCSNPKNKSQIIFEIFSN